MPAFDSFGPRSRKRMWTSLLLLGVLGAMAVSTIGPGKSRSLVLLLLGFFALRIVLASSPSR